MPINYVLISEQTVSQSVTSVTFSNIPQTGYTDLKVVWSARGTDNTSYNYITFNSGVGSGRLMYAETSGSTVASFTQTVIQPISSQTYPTVTANTFANCEMYIPNYSVAGVVKSVSVDGVTGSAASSGVLGMHTYITATTNAITTITIKQGGSTDTGTFLPGSTFYIYGIAAFGTTPTILPKAIGGDIIANDGTYWYHAFLSSGVFTPSSDLTCSTLVIAGGGGGGCGGGGAGGVVYTASSALTANTNYVATIGAGGIGGVNNVSQATNGSNSNLTGGILSLTAAVGGGKGGTGNRPVTNYDGGSGGGSNRQIDVAGTATSGQGSNGGIGFTDNASFDNGGGGGGFSVAGTAANSGANGAGGNGVSTYSSFGSATATGQNVSGTYWYAGGGSGGSNLAGKTVFNGGNGGGGGGVNGSSTTGGAGTANTGGGGGGSNTGGVGGSGIIIVRYTMV
jgi:uncharacterized protein YaiE (UPF0345 family)